MQSQLQRTTYHQRTSVAQLGGLAGQASRPSLFGMAREGLEPSESFDNGFTDRPATSYGIPRQSDPGGSRTHDFQIENLAS